VELAERAFEVAPASFQLRAAVGHCLLPRWGGSYPLVEAFARASQAQAGENPRLTALLGFVDWDRGRVAENDGHYDEAATLFTRALQAGEHWQFYEGRARVHERRKRYSDALADVANALALRPEEPDLVGLRARVQNALGRRSDAVADARLVAELDPTNTDLAWFQQHEAAAAVTQGRYLLETTKDVQGAVDRLSWGIALAGENAQLRYWRGRAYIAKKDNAHALRDLEATVRLDPRSIDGYRTVDWLLAQQQRWDEIIAHWDEYIRLEPLSGEAFIERGGAKLHKGDRDAALADARQACVLGNPTGCQVAGRTARQ
jgi:tetratricopeptide (TPR) repeat protein